MSPFSLFRRASRPSRPRELAAAGAPLGLTPVPGLSAYAKHVLDGTLFDFSRAVAAVRGTTPQGELSVVDLGFTRLGEDHAHLETVAVFHGDHGLPRLVVQPRGTERVAEVSLLRELRFKQPHPETSSDVETYFSLSYAVHVQDEDRVRALFTKAAFAAFVKIEDGGATPCLDVLPDRVAFCRASKAASADDLAAFLTEGLQLIASLRGP